ncbi:hypothetical protein COR50_06700 [Chitinophaga caeni]|uniref:Bacterial surface antigen (D15) domain-containing protein n=1 Tax=Chitinophaga caeni TaxID=2029983 RepID=A0A291QSS1_9BACT|nr:hypothetical protein [Chitinophaga caeni]ATL46894.1 hypothetical protein COR50_06700 [Chitinophaga caeni]
MNRFITRLFLSGIIFISPLISQAQTNTVTFGQNRVQYKNFKWRFYTTKHFHTYFSQNGLELGKYVAQVAEKELPSLEEFMEFTFRQRVEIIVYNNFSEYQQSNIGMGIEWQNTGGVTKFVGNKLLVYFDGDHEHLRLQIRQGIANVMLQTMMFGEDIGEFAGNAVLMDFPNWFTDGYIAYAAEHWNPKLDAELKEVITSQKYKSFNHLAFDKPLLAGQAFWYYVQIKYGKDAVPYLMYITRLNRSLKKGFETVLHQSTKSAMNDFMMHYLRRYQKDNRRRRQVTRGRAVVSKEITKKRDYMKFQPNPTNSYFAAIEYAPGYYRVQIQRGWLKPIVILKSGVRQMNAKMDPNYPLLAWNHKGSKLAVIYEKEGKTNLLVYDIITKIKIKQPLPQFDRVISFKYFFEHDNTLLLSAVKNGHTDIFTYSMSNFKVDQITDDVYDDLDPSFVAFPGKSGIIYSSNRPSATARSGDTVIPSSRYNVFLIDNWNKSSEKQVSQLTDMKYGDARNPTQYNTTHFTFTSDANGINNRYAGFFSTERAGVDSIFYVGNEILHNPDKEDLDSALMDYGTTEPDSIMVATITNDSAYTFPITNYRESIKETVSAGEKGLVSEVLKRGDYLRVYKLKTDTVALRKRNINARPTLFISELMHEDSVKAGLPTMYNNLVEPKKPEQPNFFQNEFEDEPVDTLSKNNLVVKGNPGDIPAANPLDLPIRKERSILKQAKMAPYRLRFATDYAAVQLDNTVLVTRYQPFTGQPSSPIRLTDPVNGLIRLGVTDIMEDYKFTGGFRVPSSLDGSEYYFSFINNKRRFDWNLLYYRKVDRGSVYAEGTTLDIPVKMITNLYQVGVTYPLDQVRSFRLQAGLRNDRMVFLASKGDIGLYAADLKGNSVVGKLEYVYDNTMNPAINIWKGLRYKIYGEWIAQVSGDINEAFNQAAAKGKFTYNMGFDGRYYKEIYRNFIWATRFSLDMSWGTRKLLYYLGGYDNWFSPKINASRQVNMNENYAFQTLAVNMRGYNQNARNGNNVMLLNTELRLPVFSTLLNKPLNSAFLRNFQVTSFIDIGTAWNKKLDFSRDANLIDIPNDPQNPTAVIRIRESFLGPFVGGYGFGARTSIAGYFLKVDAGWPMSGFFEGKPIWYFGMGVDF